MNKLLIFTAPSGAGKTTIVRHLLKQNNQLAFSVSAASRPMRAGEEHGVHYYFLSPNRFRELIDENAFLEWEEVYDNQYYGTLKKEVERIWALGQCVVFDIDVKGATNIKRMFPKETLAVFVKPPSPEVLFDRLRGRKTEDEKSIKKRIARATEELTYENTFDKVLLNDELEEALKNAEELAATFLAK